MYFGTEIVKMKIEVPEQVVVLDPNLSQSNTKFATMVEKYKESHARTYGNVKMHEVLNEPKKDAGKAKNSGNLQLAKKRKHADIENDDEILFNEEPPEKGQLMAARSGSRLV